MATHAVVDSYFDWQVAYGALIGFAGRVEFGYVIDGINAYCQDMHVVLLAS